MTHLVTKIGRIALTLLFVAGAIVALVLVWASTKRSRRQSRKSRSTIRLVASFPGGFGLLRVDSTASVRE